MAMPISPPIHSSSSTMRLLVRVYVNGDLFSVRTGCAVF